MGTEFTLNITDDTIRAYFNFFYRLLFSLKHSFSYLVLLQVPAPLRHGNGRVRTNSWPDF